MVALRQVLELPGLALRTGDSVMVSCDRDGGATADFGTTRPRSPCQSRCDGRGVMVALRPDTLALGKRFSDISVKNKHLIQIEINVHVVFGYRCNQLPLIERSPQWLSGPSSPLSVTAGPLDGYRTRFK